MTVRSSAIALTTLVLSASASMASDPCESFVDDYLKRRAGLAEGLELKDGDGDRLVRVDRPVDAESPYPSEILFSNGKKMRFTIDSSNNRLVRLETFNKDTVMRLDFDSEHEHCQIKIAWVIDVRKEKPLLEVRGSDLSCNFSWQPGSLLVRSCDAFIGLIFRLHDLQGLRRPVPGGPAGEQPDTVVPGL